MFTLFEAEHHCPLAGIKLYCLLIEAHGYVNKLSRLDRESNQRPLGSKCDSLLAARPRHVRIVFVKTYKERNCDAHSVYSQNASSAAEMRRRRLRHRETSRSNTGFTVIARLLTTTEDFCLATALHRDSYCRIICAI